MSDGSAWARLTAGSRLVTTVKLNSKVLKWKERGDPIKSGPYFEVSILLNNSGFLGMTCEKPISG